MSRGGQRWGALGALALAGWGAALLAASLAAPPAALGFTAAEQRLIEDYAPIMMLREQRDPPCDTAEEQFEPTEVEVVLGNPRVTLERFVEGREMEEIRKAPTAADIAGLGEDYFLNLPGDPLNAECTFAEDWAAIKKAGAPATTYAHIARQEGESGLAVQYWFFWYFNQFNDLHEGDWEGMQVVFEADTAAEALDEDPSEIGLFQHVGGEKADWDDSKVEKEETHPIVYSAAGSHATFYEAAVYVENGRGGSGLGCDNTTSPLRRVEPRPVQIPTDPAPGSRFQWLTYDGHWGQREKGYNTGPTGPQTKEQWLQPFTWMGGIRSTSPRLPGGSIVGPAVTGAFCGAVAAASELVNLEAQSPLALIIVLLVIAAAIAIPAILTTWRPVSLDPLRQRRAFGQLIRAARQLYGRHWRVLVPIGLTAILIIGAIRLLGWLAGEIVGDTRVEEDAGLSGVHSSVDDLITSFGQPIGYAIVAGAVIAFFCALDRGTGPGFASSYRALLNRFWRVVGGQLIVTVLTTLIAITVIGIPYAIKKYVDWQFVQQEILFNDRKLREALRASSALVKGSWWWTVRVAGFLWLVGIVAGPMVGFGLIFANLSLFWINVLGSVIYAIVIPYVATGRTLLYFDLGVRRSEE